MVTVIQPLISETQENALTTVLQHFSAEKESFLALGPDVRSGHIYQAVLTLRGLLPELFPLGRRVFTPGAEEAMNDAGQEPGHFYHRHECGDWGEICRSDWEENELSLTEGFRLFSVYRTAKGVKLWVITEADRSVTTILLPEEY